MDVGKPTEILDKMIDLERWWESPVGVRSGMGFIRSMEHNQGSTYANMFKDPAYFAEHQAFTLQHALPYFVTDQMVDKIWEFAKGFETVGFYPEDVPSNFGFMWLAKPVHGLDSNGKIMSNRAITWAKQSNGVVLFLYSDRHDELDEINLEMRAEFGDKYNKLVAELSVNHVQPILWGEFTPLFLGPVEEYVENYTGPYGEKYTVDAITVASQEQFALVRFVLACWEWMGYQLPSRAMPHRQMARRLGRSRLDARDVLVIDLQAAERDHIPPATHQVVKWHYRWRVREHKRHWTDKHGNRRVTTVHSYVKGDPDLPMVERDVLFNIRRGHAPYEGDGVLTDLKVTNHG